jgi:MraZ protein
MSRLQDLPSFTQNFPLLPMISHAIPFLTEGETVKQNAGAAIDPEQGEKDRLIQATLFAFRTQIRRASEQTSPPGGLRSRTPSDGTDGGSSSGSSSVRHSYFRGPIPRKGAARPMVSEAFRGEFYQKVDSKARVSIPAAFRRILEAEDPSSPEFPRPRVYMVYGGKSRNFVECYSKAGADALARQIEAMELGSLDRERAERDLISRSVMVEIEPDGRIVLPPKVRAKMGFAAEDGAGEAAFAGFSNRFKLFRREVFEAEDDDDDGIDPLTRVGRAQRAG